MELKEENERDRRGSFSDPKNSAKKLVIFLQFSYDFLTIFLQFSYDFLTISQKLRGVPFCEIDCIQIGYPCATKAPLNVAVIVI